MGPQGVDLTPSPSPMGEAEEGTPLCLEVFRFFILFLIRFGLREWFGNSFFICIVLTSPRLTPRREGEEPHPGPLQKERVKEEAVVLGNTGFTKDCRQIFFECGRSRSK